MTENEMRELICEFLTSAAVADHLGFGGAESYLWRALGVSREDLSEARYNADDGRETNVLRYLAARHSLPFPEYILEDDEYEL